MKKYVIQALALICALTMLPVFTACNGGASEVTDGTVYYTVSFNTNGGTPVESIKVREGKKATEPNDPVLDNYIFCRWLMSDGRTWYFDSKTVTKDTVLEAVWIKAEDLFDLEPMPDSDGIMITGIKLQEEFDVLEIPSVINGKKVEGIGDAAFENIHDGHAAEIVFPETVRYIGESAFAKISDVSVSFSGVITQIGESAFENSTHIKEVTLGSGMDTIPYRAFANCSGLVTANIPEGVTTVEENAYESCSSMLTLVLPSSVATIENSAFDDCDSLKTLFFLGTEEQLDAVDIAGGNDALINAKVYFYSETEPEIVGDFWHYGKNGSPEIW